MKKGDILPDVAESGEKLRVDEITGREPSTGSPRSILVKLLGAVSCGDTRDLSISAFDDPGGPASQPIKISVRCEAQRPAPCVKWLGLNWIFVPSREKVGFYVSEAEIPEWFCTEYLGVAGDPQSPLPSTSSGVLALEDGLRAIEQYGPLYLPFYDEWKALADDANNLTNALPSVRASWMERLRSISNCDRQSATDTIRARNRVGLVPAGFRPDAGGAQLFFGALHVLGNVSEIVDDGQGGYLDVGGSVGMPIADCVQLRYPIRDLENGRSNRGFRLVVYYSEAYVDDLEVASDRRVNEGFVEYLRTEAQECDKEQAPPAVPANLGK